MPLVRLTVDPRATVALRFDDPEFEAACAEKRDYLVSILGDVATWDWAPFIEDGYVIHARAGVEGGEEDRILNATQSTNAREGQMDLERANRAWWVTWVTGVEADEVEKPDAGVLAELSSTNKKTRGEAFSRLPSPVRDAFRARLRVHTESASRPALRDVAQTTPKVLETVPRHVTTSS